MKKIKDDLYQDQREDFMVEPNFYSHFLIIPSRASSVSLSNPFQMRGVKRK